MGWGRGVDLGRRGGGMDREWEMDVWMDRRLEKWRVEDDRVETCGRIGSRRRRGRNVDQ